MMLGPGSAFVAVGAAAMWLATRQPLLDPRATEFEAALYGWNSGDSRALEAVLASLAGSPAAAHALRTAALCAELGVQLALEAEDCEQLSLAAALHVLRPSGPDCEASCPGNPDPEVVEIIAGLAPEAWRIAGEVHERWDGAGYPLGLAGEAISLPGRTLGAACGFDRASAGGREEAIAAIRAGSGATFDPVIASELIHLFRAPWPLQRAA